ncbi:MAG: outer membrane protein assembly factor, partial [Muribaculaceae bacterium]|nr:outer membrane protein assembly factor [Muribaculaceae bacterium]
MTARPRLDYIIALCAIVWAALLLGGCSSTRHVPSGSYLLDKVTIAVDDSSRIATRKLYNYLRQQPNHKVLGLARMQLGVYNLSGNDSTARFNRWLRKIGEEPVIYDEILTDQSARQLRQALINSGYNDASVDVECVSPSDRKINVTYHLRPGRPHTISSVSYQVEDPALEEIIFADTISWPVKTGQPLDRNVLDNQRAIIAERMRNSGYFSFTKEYISFIADTVAGSKEVALTMTVHNPRTKPGERQQPADSLLVRIPRHRRYIYSKVVVVTDFSPGNDVKGLNFAGRDTVVCNGIEILYGKDRYLSPRNIAEQCYIIPGQNYSTTSIDRTYEALNRLSILRYVNILTQPAGSDGDTELLEAYILLSPTKKMGVTLELEGTNSEGDLGFGGGATFQHRNLAHGGEMLTAKLR